jgi:hypothetical protein
MVGTAIPITDPYSVAIAPDGATAYVTSNSSKAVYSVTLATNTVRAPISLPSAYPWGVQVTPDGSTLYVITNTIMGCGPLFAITVATRAISQVCSTGTVKYAFGFTMNPNGASLYIPGEGPSGYLPEVSIPSNTVVNGPSCDIHCYSTNDNVVLSPDGGTGYIVDSAGGGVWGELQQFDTSTNAVGPDLATGGHEPTVGFAAPDQSPVAKFTDSPAAHGSPTSFDAGGSYPRSTAIATYSWNFGDGTPMQTVTTPTTTHTYANAGTYTVTLTLTDTAGTSTQIVFTGQTVSRNGSKVATKRAGITIS